MKLEKLVRHRTVPFVEEEQTSLFSYSQQTCKFSSWARHAPPQHNRLIHQHNGESLGARSLLPHLQADSHHSACHLPHGAYSMQAPVSGLRENFLQVCQLEPMSILPRIA